MNVIPDTRCQSMSVSFCVYLLCNKVYCNNVATHTHKHMQRGFWTAIPIPSFATFTQIIGFKSKPGTKMFHVNTPVETKRQNCHFFRVAIFMSLSFSVSSFGPEGTTGSFVPQAAVNGLLNVLFLEDPQSPG